ncbi:MAG: 1-deoxy-D-xylulose-5-phosphate reductoisomerase [Oscillospiraceae bacterium]
MSKNITILGATGSIGTQSLDVCRNLGYNVTALTAHKNINLLEKQAREFNPRYVAITDDFCAKELKIKLADTTVKVLTGDEALCFLAAMEENDVVLNSLMGIRGLLPTLAAIRAGKDVALANKETLVAGGNLVMNLAKENHVTIYPIDSEHSAIFQCLQGAKREQLSKIILTASGGPFRGYNREQLKAVTKKQALNHPNWSMGEKITIDSSTMMNKGLEFIEAMNLFNCTPEQIEVVVHPQSIIHSMVEFADGAVIAQLGTPDMRVPIQYALTYPDRFRSTAPKLDITSCKALTFEKPDYYTFTPLQTCIEAAKRGGLYPCIVNGANEQAVELFLRDKISYTDIFDVVEAALNEFDFLDYSTEQQILEADSMARNFVKNKFSVK